MDHVARRDYVSAGDAIRVLVTGTCDCVLISVYLHSRSPVVIVILALVNEIGNYHAARYPWLVLTFVA